MTSVIFLDLGKFMLYLEGQMSHILIIYVIYVFREVVKQNLIQSHVKERGLGKYHEHISTKTA